MEYFPKSHSAIFPSTVHLLNPKFSIYSGYFIGRETEVDRWKDGETHWTKQAIGLHEEKKKKKKKFYWLKYKPLSWNISRKVTVQFFPPQFTCWTQNSAYIYFIDWSTNPLVGIFPEKSQCNFSLHSSSVELKIQHIFRLFYWLKYKHLSWNISRKVTVKFFPPRFTCWTQNSAYIQVILLTEVQTP